MLCESIKAGKKFMKNRSYSEMIRFASFKERFEYLKLGGTVGHETFGFDRWINQHFYQSREWKDIRHQVIVRDNGCDLGVPGHEINGGVLIHHINPINVDDIVHGTRWLLDPEYLVLTTHNTHNAIHYGDSSLLREPYKPRTPGDTKLW